jgi:ATP-dependent RNA helicase SUPV3L1/SUV3
LAQIAGRAGRYTRDGTFGTVAPIEIPSEAIFAIEEHRFEPITRMMWRNSDLDHSSIDALLASLAVRPRERGLVLADDADDETALRMLSERPEVRARARGADGVRLLWDVCRIPDFRKLLPEHHVTMLAEIHAQLSGPRGQLEADFMHERISRLEDTRGDIDTLMMRMEFIRTWNYIAHHSHWVVDAPVWQQRTQWAEDRLSEALHQQLVARFVEQRRRTRRSRPGNTTKQRGPPEPEHERDDGPFAGLRAMRDKMLPAEDALITDEICEQIVLTEHEDLDLDKRGNVSIAVDGERLHIATLARGSDLLHPEPKLAALELGPGGRARVLRRMRAYLRDLMNDALAPFRDERLAGLTAVGRGLQYQLEQGLGNVAVRDARTQLAGLPSADRQLFVGVGLSFGSRYVFAETLLTPRAIERRVALCHPYAPSFAPDGDATVVALARDVDRGSVEAMGFAALDAHAVRIDVVEQLSERLAELATHAPFGLPPALVALLETSHDDAERIVTAMGYPRTSAGFIAKRRRSRRSRRGR